MNRAFRLSGAGVVVLAGLFLSPTNAQAAQIYGLTDENDLIGFDTATPGDLNLGVPITNLAMNEDLIGIDFRPSNGLLYGVGDQGNIYTINTGTGTATFVSSITGAALSGSRFGVDFNPVADRLRIVSDLDQSLRIDVATGAATIDGTLKYLNTPANVAGGAHTGTVADNPSVSAAAYTNSFGPSPRATPGTTLYDIDVRSSEDRLVIQSPPNTGELTVVGPLNVNVSSLNGFDIFFEGGNDIAVAALQQVAGGTSELFAINLLTGAATPIGEIGGGDILDGLTVVIPEPSSIALLALCGLALRRRRA